MKNPWSNRLKFVKNHIPHNLSIIDFGCGNCEARDVVHAARYVGVDQLPGADIVADLDSDFFLEDQFDMALLLGVLEYVKDPDHTLSNIVRNADQFIVLSLAVNQKSEWQRAFTKSTIDQLLHKHFLNVQHYHYGSYILSVCNK